MNENINLYEILKGHEGETFYSLYWGEIKLTKINDKFLIFQNDNNIMNEITSFNGKSIYSQELDIFPSKDQRDWNKWDEENNHKVPKTWSEIKKEERFQGNAVIVVNKEELIETPIIKSANALLKIHQLIDIGYGGNVTDEEWDIQNTKYTIRPFHYTTHYFDIITTTYYPDKCHIAFHTMEQAEEFLKYPENIQLLKDYFMIN